jgi:hypothetical protein
MFFLKVPEIFPESEILKKYLKKYFHKKYLKKCTHTSERADAPLAADPLCSLDVR